MKKILISWCGITDMRAAMGYEQSCAIMSTLIHQDYSDLYVLLYTDEQKKLTTGISSFCDIENRIQEIGTNIQAQNEFHKSLSNTALLNNYFERTIKLWASERGINTGIYAQNVALSDLNDVEAIYSAAIRLLNRITETREERVITLNLSSGTPTMAFVWAFASLRYPQEQIELICSSRKERAPEIVNLPVDWKRWHSRRIYSTSGQDKKWDVVYHLFGEQRMPALVGVQKLQAQKHVFLASPQYPSACMEPYVGEAEYEELRIDAYDWENLHRTITAHLNALPQGATVAFNLTGGTKIMYACALDIAKNVHAPAFYFDFRNKRMVDLQNNSSRKLDYSLNLETLTMLHSTTPLLKLAENGKWLPDQERANLLQHIYVNRNDLKNWARAIRRVYHTPVLENELMAMTSFQNLDADKISVSLQENGACQINWDGASFSLKNYPGIVKFLLGGWLEEFFYVTCILPLMKEKLIKEARLGVELTSAASPDSVYQELDVAFTNGKRLFIVECKSGHVLGEYITKLSAIVRNYGGLGGRGILCHTEAIYSKVIKEKAEEMGILLLRIYPYKKDYQNGWSGAVQALRKFVQAE